MAIKDLREYINVLEREGEIQRIEAEVDRDLEVGAIIRRSYDLKAPAPFFQNIKGFPKGYRILGAPVGVSRRPDRYFARLAISLGLPPNSSYVELGDRYAEKIKNPIKPVVVSSGPCKENIMKGNDVDLEKFPAPLIHDGDGGRYLGTWHLFATKDPDSGWVNWGMYRIMVHDKRSHGILLGDVQHGQFHLRKYLNKGKPMEFAVAMGTEPVTPIIASNRVPPGIPEADIVGGVRGEPLELVQCETVDLQVPATSEIVWEGTISPGDLQEEGPFGEYTGYMAGDRAPRPVCRVSAITHRTDPILPVTCMGTPVDDSAAQRPLQIGLLRRDLIDRGFPIKMVYSPPTANPHLLVISTRVPYPRYPINLAAAAYSSPYYRGIHQIFIVDEDVDATNMDEVLWAFSSRCHPGRGIYIEKTVGQPLIPFLSLAEKKALEADRVMFDCTWPKTWKPEEIPIKASFDVMWPKEVQEKVLKRWKEYGYSS